MIEYRNEVSQFASFKVTIEMFSVKMFCSFVHVMELFQFQCPPLKRLPLNEQNAKKDKKTKTKIPMIDHCSNFAYISIKNQVVSTALAVL